MSFFQNQLTLTVYRSLLFYPLKSYFSPMDLYNLILYFRVFRNQIKWEERKSF